MGDASGNHNKQSNMDQYVQRGGKRTHTQLERTRDDVTPTITPTPSRLGDSSGMETDPDLSEGENSTEYFSGSPSKSSGNITQ